MGPMTFAALPFWLIVAALTLFAGATLWRAGRKAVTGGADADMRLYRDQLAEVERDLARGTVTAGEAERIRTEVARRLLDADRRMQAADAPVARDGGAVLGGVLAVALAGGVAGYLWLGAPGYPDLPVSLRIERAAEIAASRPGQAEAAGPEKPLTDPDSPGDARLIADLRNAVAARPGDLAGQQLLAEQESRLGNDAAAAAAQAGVIRLKGSEATAADHAILADLLVRAADGYVSPEAEAAVTAALALDPGNGLAQFYLGLMQAQTARPDLAFQTWRALLETSPEAAPWVPVIRERIGMLADAAGVDYALPEATRGPDAAALEAAGDMAPEDRQAMIEGMVEGLAERLANQGGTGAEWAQLIAALGVLGDTDRARAIFAEAEDVFAGSPDDLTLVTEAARKAGIAE
jgi:cytochrome c-type biogenesis protein CcmH